MACTTVSRCGALQGWNWPTMPSRTKPRSANSGTCWSGTNSPVPSICQIGKSPAVLGSDRSLPIRLGTEHRIQDFLRKSLVIDRASHDHGADPGCIGADGHFPPSFLGAAGNKASQKLECLAQPLR